MDAANAVIDHNLVGAPSGLFTVTTSGNRSALPRENEYDEASFVASEIFRLRNAAAAFGDVAIYYRTKRPEPSLEEELVPPVSLQGRRRLAFLRPREIKDISAYVRLLANPMRGLRRRVVNTPKARHRAMSVTRLAAWAQANDMSFSAALTTVPKPASAARRCAAPPSWPSCSRAAPS